MKKIMIILVLMVIPAFSCFAGSFYSNIVILSVEAEKILPILLQMGITAYYVMKNKICVIYENRIDEQDIGYGLKLTAELSQKLNSTAIYSTNHDSDVLIMYIYKNGQEIFLYNSNPEYFGDENMPLSMNKVDKLLLEYENINKEEFLEILNTEETFSEDIHYKIAEKLNLPEYSVNYGFNIINYMDEAELGEIESEYEIKIEKIGEE
jgi:hypothetical protein